MEATNIKHCFLITAIDSIPGQMREHLVNVFIELLKTLRLGQHFYGHNPIGLTCSVSRPNALFI